MSNVSTLIEVGPDAFTNLYDVIITFPKKVIESSEQLTNIISVRVQDFPFPELTLAPYTVSYKSVQLKRFAPKIEGARKLTLTFRLDAGWGVYELFKAWKRLYSNENTTDITFSNFAKDPNDDESYGNILVKAYKSSSSLSSVVDPINASGKLWKFENVSCVNVEEPQFTRDSANVINVTATFLFGVYTPPEVFDAMS